jgi:trimethylamine:corrinoid methyltransferase-like protein
MAFNVFRTTKGTLGEAVNASLVVRNASRIDVPETRRLFPGEQHVPSKIIDRGSVRAWQAAGGLEAFGRAKVRVSELLATYQRPKIAEDVERDMFAIVRREAQAVGLETLPGV